MAEQSFDAGAVAINYAVEGPADGPPIVFLHGVMGRWQAWLQVMPAFAGEWRVYALDHRGHGRSGHAPGRYRILDYAEDAAGFLRGVVGRPAVLVGHSLGAIIAVAVAADAPELVRAAVLEDPPIGAFADQSFAERAERPWFTSARELVRARLPREELFAALSRLNPQADAAALGMRTLALGQMDPEVLTPILDDSAKDGLELYGRLARIERPVLLQQGNVALGAALEDVRVERVMAALRHGSFARFDDVGHGIHGERPFAFCGSLGGFLAGLPG
jgi:pimeloyl-ACP methyl ester carboxylesterase